MWRDALDILSSLCESVQSAKGRSASVRYTYNNRNRRVVLSVISFLNTLGVVRRRTSRGSRLYVDDSSIFWHMAKANKCNELRSELYEYLCSLGFKDFCTGNRA